MAYSGASTKTTEFAGTYKTSTVKITPDAATGSYTFTDLTAVTAIVGCVFAGDLTANCYSLQAAIDGSVANKVNVKLWKAGGTAADTAYVALWLTVIGY